MRTWFSLSSERNKLLSDLEKGNVQFIQQTGYTEHKLSDGYDKSDIYSNVTYPLDTMWLSHLTHDTP